LQDLGSVEQAGGGPGKDDLAMLKHMRAVGEGGGYADILLNQQNGKSARVQIEDRIDKDVDGPQNRLVMESRAISGSSGCMWISARPSG
jgi:hypothetical protein